MSSLESPSFDNEKMPSRKQLLCCGRGNCFYSILSNIGY